MAKGSIAAVFWLLARRAILIEITLRFAFDGIKSGQFLSLLDRHVASTDAFAIALFSAVLAGAAAAEDMDDCQQGAATFALKGCTSWLAREKEPDARATAFHRRGLRLRNSGRI